MPRRRLVKELCDCLKCRDQLPADSVAGTAVALQKPPPKCLILYVPNCYQSEPDSGCFTIPLLRLQHIDSVVQHGCSGLLAIRTGDLLYLQGYSLNQDWCCASPLSLSILNGIPPAEDGLHESGDEKLILKNLFGTIPVRNSVSEN